ncbi:MAG: uracil-DNA glycosylase, partial [Ignavibacteria bacterium]|nr:uracil-DNA glycosylase [Ignavibacteria bacterium]
MERVYLEKILTEAESIIEYHNDLQVPIYLSAIEKKKSPEFNDELLNSILKKINEPFVKTSSIDELYHSISNCKKCSLGNTRTNFVFGVGNPNADIVFIGEAPGA